MLTLDGHAVYVLGSYAVAAVGLIGILVASYRRWQAMERLVGTLERSETVRGGSRRTEAGKGDRDDDA